MKMLQLTSSGTASEISSVLINLDNVTSIYPSELNRHKGNTTICFVNGSITYIDEKFEDICEAIKKCHGY